MAATSSSITCARFPSLLMVMASSQSQPQMMPVTVGIRSSTICCCAYRKRTKSRHPANRLVDESMITLRKRMHEAKLAEQNYEPPSDWMDWEKRYYIQYGTDVFELVGLLQGLLINTRPSLALGLMAIIAVSVPATTILGLHLLIDLCGFLLSPVNFLS
ncbi:mediator of RNA polymerase II transcription subunit [Rhynchospora pubera]|uniref:Mediator of RNA polymerase II transcription subunit n=1 Tax=Rhynchospora pubera TaxID=906938 RepID=A0AAV8CEM1_9POAL|nr:mediator of RNA polymerase II transcription subunit [Rhynchospora pubera]